MVAPNKVQATKKTHQALLAGEVEDILSICGVIERIHLAIRHNSNVAYALHAVATPLLSLQANIGMPSKCYCTICRSAFADVKLLGIPATIVTATNAVVNIHIKSSMCSQRGTDLCPHQHQHSARQLCILEDLQHHICSTKRMAPVLATEHAVSEDFPLQAQWQVVITYLRCFG